MRNTQKQEGNDTLLTNEEMRQTRSNKNIATIRWPLPILEDLREKAVSDSQTRSDAQKLLGHKDSKTAAIYRRDKNDIVLPLDENNLFSLKKKVL